MTVASVVAILLEVATTDEPGAASSSRVKRLAESLAPVVLVCAAATGETPQTLAHFGWQESSYRPWVVGHLRERGVWQILPKTGRRMCKDLKWRRNTLENCLCAARVIAWARTTRCEARVAYTGACGKRKRAKNKARE